MCLVSGCMSVGDEPTATIEIKTPTVQATSTVKASQIEATDLGGGPDLCAAAAQLPANDVCSLICDPPAMADYLVTSGMRTGACYELRCTLPGVATGVNVGVCLSP